ncbi:hypothetical protein AAFF_G00428970 [Aldrovandia affinis]|uniref:A20-type domain-containing protein n=1 Tax=Aldrovandia affinis TaxID=143900 RepID=A0AAD7S968_9TELE|nr:hypothetical protein AAFF_G00428970 [Aldrovandia affinis]
MTALKDDGREESNRGIWGRICRGGDMAQETNPTQAPLLCVTGCGFYGNPRTSGMCSVCYKDFLQRQNSSGRISPAVSPSVSEPRPSLCSDSSLVTEEPPSPPQTATPPEQSSVASSQTLLRHCEEDDSPGVKVGRSQETDQSQG